MAYKFTIDGKERIQRTIEDITDTEGKTSLGVAAGIDIGHCIYIASRHCETSENFLKDVRYYRICSKEESLDPKCPVTIEFYK
jgi:hypothetical protein